jgi:hypothetical protein
MLNRMRPVCRFMRSMFRLDGAVRKGLDLLEQIGWNEFKSESNGYCFRQCHDEDCLISRNMGS